MGPDSTPNIVLKTCAEKLAQGLRDVFHKIGGMQIYPLCSKKAIDIYLKIIDLFH